MLMTRSMELLSCLSSVWLSFERYSSKRCSALWVSCFRTGMFFVFCFSLQYRKEGTHLKKGPHPLPKFSQVKQQGWGGGPRKLPPREGPPAQGPAAPAPRGARCPDAGPADACRRPTCSGARGRSGARLEAAGTRARGPHTCGAKFPRAACARDGLGGRPPGPARGSRSRARGG